MAYCNRCFVFIIEKRIKKALRDSGLLRSGVKLYPESADAKIILQRVVSMPVVFVKKTAKHVKHVGHVVRINLDTLDDDNISFLENYLGSRKQRKKGKTLSLFKHVTDEEAVRYFLLLEKKYTPKKNVLKNLLCVFFVKYPETRYALHQAKSEYVVKVLKGSENYI